MRTQKKNFIWLSSQAIGLVILLLAAGLDAVSGESQWSAIGPWGGDRYEVIVDPNDNQKLYVVGGGIHKSLDGGAHWDSIMDTAVESVGLYAYSLVVNPQNTSELFVGTGFDGVWKSSNGGQLWSPASNGLPETDMRIRSLTIDARNPATLYAGIENDSGEVVAAVYRSEDSGASWTAFDAGLPDSASQATFIVQNPVSHELYAGTLGEGVFKFNAGIQQWVPMNTGLSSPLGLDITDIAFDFNDANIMFAATFKDWVYKSLDGGQTWLPIEFPLPLNAAYPPLAYFLETDPNNSGIVWVGALPGGNWPNEAPYYRAQPEQDLGALFLSTDGGTSWTVEREDFGGFGLTIDSAETILVGDELRSRNVYGVHGGIWSVQKSEDGGVSFQRAVEGLNGNWMNCMYQDPVQTSRLYSCNESGMFYSFDSGDNWSLFKLVEGRELIYSWSAAADPADASRLYYTTGEPAWAWPENKGLYVMDTSRLDPGQDVDFDVYGEQLPSTAGIGTWKVYPFGLSTLYLATQDRGVLKSTDSGSSWQEMSSGLAEMSVTSVAFDENSEPLFAGTREYDGRIDFVPALSTEVGGLYKWAADTQQWLRVAEAEISVPVYDVVVSPHAPNIVYAGTESGLFMSTDSGASWSKQTFGLKEAFPVSDIEIDPNDSQRMFVSSWVHGVYASSNGGSHWYQYNTDLINKSVDEIMIDRSQPEKLYAATLGGSVVEHSASGSAPRITSVTSNGVPLAAPYVVSVEELEFISLVFEAEDNDTADVLTVTAFFDNHAVPAPHEVTDPLVDLNFDPASGTLLWMPGYGSAVDSPYTMIVVVSDGTLSQAVELNIQVTAVWPPVVDGVIANGVALEEPYEVRIEEGQQLTIEVLGHDPDGTAVEYTAYLGNNPIPRPEDVQYPEQDFTFDPMPQIFNWTPGYGTAAPDTPYAVTFILSDGLFVTSATVNIFVDPAPTVIAPTIELMLNQAVYNPGDSMDLDLSIENQHSPVDVDIYLILGTESNPYMRYIPLIQGVNLARGLKADITPISNLQLNAFPAGNYLWSAVILPKGGDASDSSSWIHSATASFTVVK